MRLTITSAWSQMRPREPRCAGILLAGRHINTNPGSMSDIAISQCLRVHYLYEAFRAGPAEVQRPQTVLRADFLEDWP